MVSMSPQNPPSNPRRFTVFGLWLYVGINNFPTYPPRGNGTILSCGPTIYRHYHQALNRCAPLISYSFPSNCIMRRVFAFGLRIKPTSIVIISGGDRRGNTLQRKINTSPGPRYCIYILCRYTNTILRTVLFTVPVLIFFFDLHPTHFLYPLSLLRYIKAEINVAQTSFHTRPRGTLASANFMRGPRKNIF